MTLRGPADADAFRVKVGRYGDRWYHDPLPSCDVAEATTDQWPSATTVKKAWPKFLTTWAATEAATYAVDSHDAWRNLDRQTAISVIAKASDRTRDRAGNRGTKVHELLERISQGHALDPVLDDDVTDWAPAMQALIADVDPEWVLAEAVVISRTLQVAGTLDAVWRIDGKTYLVDFKTRGEGKGGNAYADEGVQLGLYSCADYAIVEQDGQAVRQPLPDLDGGLIVTISPEGYRLFPVDLEVAREGAVVLRSFWEVQRASAIGKPVHLRQPIDPETTGRRMGRRAWLIGCLEEIREAGYLADLAARWPAGVPTFKQQGQHNDAQLDAIAAAVDAVGALHELPFFRPDPVDVTVPRVTDFDTARVDKLRADFGDDALFAALVDAACLGEHRPLGEFTHKDSDRLTALCQAVNDGIVSITVDDDGPHARSNLDLAALVLERGTKSAALAHAKQVAANVGAHLPATLAEVVTDPLLAAALHAA